MERICKILVMYDWYDFGIVLRINKCSSIGNYHFAIDIQIAWFNIWLQFWKKKNNHN